MTLNLIACTLTEEWTVDFGNGPIWQSEVCAFPHYASNPLELFERHAAINMYRCKKVSNDSRDLYTVIK